MKSKIAALVALLFCAATLSLADNSMTGYISDSHCGAKGAKEGHAECVTKCVKEHGAKYVFVDDKDHKVYNIADQSKVVDHAGHHVTVQGKVEGDTLTVESISMAK